MSEQKPEFDDYCKNKCSKRKYCQCIGYEICEYLEKYCPDVEAPQRRVEQAIHYK